MVEPAEKAAILQEALPYIRRFRDKTFVVKLGGNAMVDEALRESFARDICLLRFVGMRVIVVHGGGPQINQTLVRLGIPSVFSGGLRVTDADTMRVVEMVLGGQINQDIVGLITQFGGRAVGLSGKDDHFIGAKRMDPVSAAGEDGKPVTVDLGHVGRVDRVNPQIISDLIERGYIPVISPIGVDESGRSLNVNADTAAGRIAAALTATKLILMTDVDGVADADGRRVGSLNATEADELVQKGVIHSGMIPKVRCALDAVDSGVEKTHIIDGKRRHALLLEVFTDEGVGTQIHRATKAV